MKILPVLLGVSLAANAALLVVNLPEGGGGASKSAAGGGGSAGASGAGLVLKPEGPATGDGKAIAQAIKNGDLDKLRDELRAAGVEEDVVRSIVGARLWKRYEAKFKALQPASDLNKPWWKNDEDGNWGGWAGQTKEQREQARLLRDEQKAEMERLLGKDPNALANNPWLERQYGFLASEKREEIQRMEQDYNELSSELRRESRGFMLPSDQEKLRFLEEEKKRDLVAMLTPEELEQYELRQSRTAQNLRWRMTQMDASEAEFRTIFEYQKEFDERFNEHDQFGMRVRNQGPEDWKIRQEAEKKMKDELKTALGAERYAAYVRAQDGDYQQLRNATKRFELPADTPDKIYAMRDEVPKEAVRIADDASMTADQKKAALAKLAADTRTRVQATLGSEVAQAYFANNGMQWLSQMEKGTIITFDENGGQSHRRVDQVPRPAKPPAGGTGAQPAKAK